MFRLLSEGVLVFVPKVLKKLVLSYHFPYSVVLFFRCCCRTGFAYSSADTTFHVISYRTIRYPLCCGYRSGAQSSRSRLALVWQATSEADLFGADDIAAMQVLQHCCTIGPISKPPTERFPEPGFP